MFRLDVLQNQWLMLSLTGGIALILGMVLFLLMLWKPREEGKSETPGESELAWRTFPWFLVVVYVGLILFAVVYVIHTAMVSPNW